MRVPDSPLRAAVVALAVFGLVFVLLAGWVPGRVVAGVLLAIVAIAGAIARYRSL